MTTGEDKRRERLNASLANEHGPVLRAMCRQLRDLGRHPARVIALMGVLDGTMNPALHAETLSDFEDWVGDFSDAADRNDGDRRKHIMSRKAAVEWAIAELDGQACR